MFTHLMYQLRSIVPVRAGRAPARTVSAETKPIHPVRSDPTSAAAASRLSSRNHRTRLDIGNDEVPKAEDLRPSTKRTTKAATWSNGTSTFSSSGEVWQPATTSSHSPTAAVPFSEQSASG